MKNTIVFIGGHYILCIALTNRGLGGFPSDYDHVIFIHPTTGRLGHVTAGNVGFEPATKSDFNRASASKSLARDPVSLRFTQILPCKVRVCHRFWTAAFPVLFRPKSFR